LVFSVFSSIVSSCAYRFETGECPHLIFAFFSRYVSFFVLAPKFDTRFASFAWGLCFIFVKLFAFLGTFVQAASSLTIVRLSTLAWALAGFACTTATFFGLTAFSLWLPATKQVGEHCKN
jgi:hypothetical protein